ASFKTMRTVLFLIAGKLDFSAFNPHASIMKSLIKAIALVVVIAAPVASFAQTEQPLTRAEVKAQLIQIEQAGYNPAASGDSTYPGDIQAAEARVAAQHDTTGYGSSANGSSQTGTTAPAAPAAQPAPMDGQ
ncbi:hypothetical protein KCU90_g3930, partial [Aureobasidium melanogenum]